MSQEEIYKNIEQTMIVCRDGAIDEEYYQLQEALERREALNKAGREVIRLVTLPIRNFSLNMLDIINRDLTNVT